MRKVTVAELFRRASKRADMTNSNFYSQQDKFDLLNECYPALYDILVKAYENYYVGPDYEFSIGANTFTYDLPEDFYKIVGVDYKVGQDQWITLRNFNESSRNSTLTAQNLPTGTIRLRYIPAPAVFSSLTDEIDGVSGWDALLVTEMAIAMLTSEESSTSTLERLKASQMRRIVESSQNRDTGMPATVSDSYAINDLLYYDSLRYRLYGDQIRFMRTDWLGVGGMS